MRPKVPLEKSQLEAQEQSLDGPFRTDSAEVSVSTAPIPSKHDSAGLKATRSGAGTDQNKMECLYQYAVEHGLDPEKLSTVTEAEKKRWADKCFCGDLDRDILIYRSSIGRKVDPRKYYTFLTDRDRLIGKEILHCALLERHISLAWLNDLMKEWEKTHTQFIQVFA